MIGHLACTRVECRARIEGTTPVVATTLALPVELMSPLAPSTTSFVAVMLTSPLAVEYHIVSRERGHCAISGQADVARTTYNYSITAIGAR